MVTNRRRIKPWACGPILLDFTFRPLFLRTVFTELLFSSILVPKLPQIGIGTLLGPEVHFRKCFENISQVEPRKTKMKLIHFTDGNESSPCLSTYVFSYILSTYCSSRLLNRHTAAPLPSPPLRGCLG